MSDAGKRRTDRVSITLPISISGIDSSGKPFSEDASTVTVSQFGAAIASKSPLTGGQELIIRRQRNRTVREAECQVITQIGYKGDLQVFSVAFQNPAVGFWDIYFPSLPADIETAGRAFVMCKTCNTRRIIHLNSQELTTYHANHQLLSPCDSCGKSTLWVESQQDPAKSIEVKVANSTRLTPPAPPPVENLRKHRRVTAEIPVCIRQVDTEDQMATSMDISRGGLCFNSTRPYPAGSYIQVAVPYSPTAVNIFVDARVVHTAKVADSDTYKHGVMYLAENAGGS